jgi:hypothetical protein
MPPVFWNCVKDSFPANCKELHAHPLFSPFLIAGISKSVDHWKSILKDNTSDNGQDESQGVLASAYTELLFRLHENSMCGVTVEQIVLIDLQLYGKVGLLFIFLGVQP